MGLFKSIYINSKLNDNIWLKNQIGKPIKKPSRRFIKDIEKIAIALEEIEGCQFHVVPASFFNINDRNRILIIDKKYRVLYNKYCAKIKGVKRSYNDILNVALFSTSGKRKIV